MPDQPSRAGAAFQLLDWVRGLGGLFIVGAVGVAAIIAGGIAGWILGVVLLAVVIAMAIALFRSGA